ncbi:CU044_2847 family protein [Shewanella sp. GXUN23E]|uniref:CU044_2847 family protein n=1 Tax=Shewanella sp. GXUN23E TaxID=3422498 RepID=UPI003D7D9319
MIKEIETKDGLKFEIEVDSTDYLEINSNGVVDSAIEKIDFIIDKMTGSLEKVSAKVLDNKVDEVKIAIGLKLSASGDFVVAKSSMEGNIQVELTIRNSNV